MAAASPRQVRQSCGDMGTVGGRAQETTQGAQLLAGSLGPPVAPGAGGCSGEAWHSESLEKAGALAWLPGPPGKELPRPQCRRALFQTSPAARPPPTGHQPSPWPGPRTICRHRTSRFKTCIVPDKPRLVGHNDLPPLPTSLCPFLPHLKRFPSLCCHSSDVPGNSELSFLGCEQQPSEVEWARQRQGLVVSGPFGPGLRSAALACTSAPHPSTGTHPLGLTSHYSSVQLKWGVGRGGGSQVQTKDLVHTDHSRPSRLTQASQVGRGQSLQAGPLARAHPLLSGARGSRGWGRGVLCFRDCHIPVQL